MGSDVVIDEVVLVGLCWLEAKLPAWQLENPYALAVVAMTLHFKEKVLLIVLAVVVVVVLLLLLLLLLLLRLLLLWLRV